MKKLSFEQLSTMAENVADTALLEQISGGTENDCHDDLATDDTPLGQGTPIELPDQPNPWEW